MCLSGFRGTSIPEKQGLRDLSPERGFKMTLEFYDAFRGVGPIKYLCFAVYKTSKFINMYSSCFEWKRTGSVTGESTQSWPGQFLHNLQIHKYVFRLFWMEENWVCDGGEYTKLTWPNFYTTSKFINMYSGCFERKRVCDGGQYAKLTWPNFYETSKVIHMYSGCFEWKRTGSVTVESTQSWPCQNLRGDLRKRIPMMYTCCYIENFSRTLMTMTWRLWLKKINLAPFENTVPIVGWMCRSRKTLSSDVSIFVFNKKPAIFWSGHYKFILEWIYKTIYKTNIYWIYTNKMWWDYIMFLGMSFFF